MEFCQFAHSDEELRNTNDVSKILETLSFYSHCLPTLWEHSGLFIPTIRRPRVRTFLSMGSVSLEMSVTSFIQMLRRGNWLTHCRAFQMVFNFLRCHKSWRPTRRGKLQSYSKLMSFYPTLLNPCRSETFKCILRWWCLSSKCRWLLLRWTSPSTSHQFRWTSVTWCLTVASTRTSTPIQQLGCNNSSTRTCIRWWLPRPCRTWCRARSHHFERQWLSWKPFDLKEDRIDAPIFKRLAKTSHI